MQRQFDFYFKGGARSASDHCAWMAKAGAAPAVPPALRSACISPRPFLGWICLLSPAQSTGCQDCRSILLFVPCGCVLFLSLLFAWDRRGCICWGVAAYRAQRPC